MRKTAGIAGVVAAGAGMLTGTATAVADSTDNDGVNAGDGNNVSAVPIQLCGNNIAVLGAVVPILSPQDSSCENAPAVDHAQQDSDAEPQQPDEGRGDGDPSAEPEVAPEAEPEVAEPEVAEPEVAEPEVAEPEVAEPEVAPEVENTGETGESREGSLPTAPSPQIVQGHHAVTG